MTKKFEKTQRGNPHQLTIKQHCFPKKSIERFANSDGRVHVHLIGYDKTEFLKPDEYIFCARRTWDQRAETGYMREIEDRYQELADKIAASEIVRQLNPREKNVVTDMYILWNCRWHWNKAPINDQKIKGALGVTHEYSEDEQELLEKEGIGVIKPDLSISGRHLTGFKIQQNIFNERKHMRGCSWGILNSREAEFIVPDNPAHRIMLPVTPNVCLINEESYQFASEHKVAEMNDLTMESSEKYYFARSL